MKKYKVLTVVGARPQFIKAAALSRAFRSSDRIEEIILHSGQHYDSNLSDDFFKELNIPRPLYNLDIGSRSHISFLGAFLLKFEEVLIQESPDIVVVYGDTNTTSAAAIAAAKSNIPIVHVEAGLREHDKSIPEEVNKLLTDAVSDIWLSPTQTGIDNLRKEGKVTNVYKTGDISLDLLFNNPQLPSREELVSKYEIPNSYVFATCHRDANTSDKTKLQAIFEAFADLDIPVFLPLHPRTSAALDRYNLTYLLEDITILQPLPFWDTQGLLRYADLCITDSGGIIKEAYFHKVPSIIVDQQTEWLEAINEGWARIAGPSKEKITNFAQNVVLPKHHSQALGDGHSGHRITKIIIDYLDAKG